MNDTMVTKYINDNIHKRKNHKTDSVLNSYETRKKGHGSMVQITHTNDSAGSDLRDIRRPSSHYRNTNFIIHSEVNIKGSDSESEDADLLNEKPATFINGKLSVLP